MPVVEVGPVGMGVDQGGMGMFVGVEVVSGQAVMGVLMMLVVVAVVMEMDGGCVGVLMTMVIFPQTNERGQQHQKSHALHQADAFAQPKQG